MRSLCQHRGLSGAELDKLDHYAPRRRTVRRGGSLVRTGDAFHHLYAIRSGFFKTTIIHEDGREQITGFQMPGELIGLDGIAEGRYCVDASALQDSEVCVIPRAEIDRVMQCFTPFQNEMQRIMSREIVREQRVILLLGSLSAEERVASFLVNLSDRYQRLGLPADRFTLCMTRQEIGTHLGLKLETVSRWFSRLQSQGVIDIDGKQVAIRDQQRLHQLAHHAATKSR